MLEQQNVTEQGRPLAGIPARDRLLAGLPVTQHRYRLAGIDTPVLEGGAGTPLVLLHGPGEHAAKWLRTIPLLVGTHRVVAPDLPGHGESEVTDGALDADRVIRWLDELIERTCPAPPVLVGNILGGAIAARYAIAHGDRISRLVLVDSLGLAPFDPAPEFGGALVEYVTRPGEDTFDRIWRYCAHDLDGVRAGMGASWEALRSYTVSRVRTTSVRAAQQALMEAFGFPGIPADELSRIPVPTSLVWGRHDLATRLQVAEAASERHGWPLHVIERSGDDPPIERPEAFADALRAVLGER